MKLAVVYPLKPHGSDWHNWELRTSLRSIAQHLDVPDYKVYVLTDPTTAPPWLSDEVEIIDAAGYKAALVAASQIEAEHLLWMNDDILLLQRETMETLATPLRMPGRLPQQTTDHDWQRLRFQLGEWLRANGHPDTDYSTHTPYLYETASYRRSLEAAKSIPDAWSYKFPMESLHYNLHRIKAKPARGQKIVYKEDAAVPDDITHKRFFNHFPGAVPASQRLRGFIRGLTPRTCQFEKNGQTTHGQRTPVFVHNPKAAGSSIYRALKLTMPHENGTNHLRPEHPLMRSWAQRGAAPYWFMVCRDPRDRAVSAFYWFFNRREKRPWKFNFGVQEACNAAGNPSAFYERVDLTVIAANSPHFRRQIFYQGNQHFDQVLRFENLKEDFEIALENMGLPKTQLPHRNQTVRKSWKEELSAQALSNIKEFYQPDFDAFRYS